ncbi:uncharacterized protein I303_108040 [Kwoniella dejecticola CBS 10117]|uniref:Uncharacterized protein n=1 Tax=Kwoniella dejecticola CBS 10117 TaxID=1296121 RepID=A0A1A5ZWD8_9TREE|nr:uncharacterized protein I303_08031 [Kwoniella dejecticola CBS 10117]OBR82117.1 hypothetical protein I303_08031 [Kwoniella dejecticola CBS 10117]
MSTALQTGFLGFLPPSQNGSHKEDKPKMHSQKYDDLSAEVKTWLDRAVDAATKAKRTSKLMYRVQDRLEEGDFSHFSEEETRTSIGLYQGETREHLAESDYAHFRARAAHCDYTAEDIDQFLKVIYGHHRYGRTLGPSAQLGSRYPGTAILGSQYYMYDTLQREGGSRCTFDDWSLKGDTKEVEGVANAVASNVWCGDKLLTANTPSNIGEPDWRSRSDEQGASDGFRDAQLPDRDHTKLRDHRCNFNKGERGRYFPEYVGTIETFNAPRDDR